MLVTRENYGAGRCALLILFAVYYTSIFSTYYSQHEGTPSAMLVFLAGCTGYPQNSMLLLVCCINRVVVAAKRWGKCIINTTGE